MKAPVFNARVAQDNVRVLCGVQYASGHPCGGRIGERSTNEAGWARLWLPTCLGLDPKTGFWRLTDFARKLEREGMEPPRVRRKYKYKGRGEESATVAKNDPDCTRARLIDLPAVVECRRCRRPNKLDPDLLDVDPVATMVDHHAPFDA